MALSSRIPLYLFLLALEAALTAFVVRRAAKGGPSVRELIGGRWSSTGEVVRDVIIAGALWGAWTMATHLLAVHSGAVPNRTVQSMLPRGPIETVLWVLVSCSAGFAEELAFRGYLLRKARARTGSTVLALIIQAIVFGVLHGYQGARAVAGVTLYGMAFGLIALWRRSLRPGMMAHAWTDIAAGIFQI